MSTGEVTVSGNVPAGVLASNDRDTNAHTAKCAIEQQDAGGTSWCCLTPGSTRPCIQQFPNTAVVGRSGGVDSRGANTQFFEPPARRKVAPSHRDPLRRLAADQIIFEEFKVAGTWSWFSTVPPPSSGFSRP